MEQHLVKQIELEPLPEVESEYFPDTRTLIVATDKPWGEGEEIAKGLVVFYDKDNNVAGFTLECSELLLKPFVDAILAKQRGEPVPPVLRSIGGVEVPVEQVPAAGDSN